MLLFLLWIAIFLDVLDSFTPRSTVNPVFTTNIFATSDTLDPTNSNLTLTLPRFLTSEEDYPSALHKIYVRPLLSEEESKIAVDMAIEYATSTGRWEEPDFDRHVSYATCDFPVENCENLENYLKDIGFDGRLWKELSDLYDVDAADLSYLDLFVAHYQSKDEENTSIMDRLEAHRDGTLLSFSLLLNSPEEFTGGGTFYDALRDVAPSGILHGGGVIRPDQAGQAVLHCGKILHGADVVTSGSRTVLVGFVDVPDRYMRRGALAKACTDFGRMDVAKYRFERQSSKGHKEWASTNDRWLQGHGHVKGLIPAFSSVIRRAEPEYQRLQKLESEDELLRQLLLAREERQADILEGEITIL
jgi:hypothetical protein